MQKMQLGRNTFTQVVSLQLLLLNAAKCLVFRDVLILQAFFFFQPKLDNNIEG